MSLQPPEFHSDIPEHLLENVTPQDRWMMENVSVLNQKTSWLTATQTKQNEELGSLTQTSEEIKIQTTKTNGRVTALEEINKENTDSLDELKKFILLKKIIFNKWSMAIIGLAAIGFFTLVIPWIRATPAKEIAETLKILFGG